MGTPGAGRPARRVCQQSEKDAVFWCPTQGVPVGGSGQTHTHLGEELARDDYLGATGREAANVSH